MKISTKVRRKIATYTVKGGLSQTATLLLDQAEVNHCEVKDHMERVALLSDAVAKALKKDHKATFFAALLHDNGKILEPFSLFDGHNITAEEYAQVKKHVLEGFLAMRKHHLFTAYCAGLHHSMCFRGYGLTAKDFPSNWHNGTIKKILEISMIISICDFIDAFTHRKTQIKDGSDANAPDLKTMLYQKYPDDIVTIDLALKLQVQLGLN